MVRWILSFVALTGAVSHSNAMADAGEPCQGRWNLQLTSANWGDISARFVMRAETPDRCTGRHEASDGVIRLQRADGKQWQGQLQFSNLPPQPLRLDLASGQGSVSAGSMQGPLRVSFDAPALPARNYPELARELLVQVPQQIYRPQALQHPGWDSYAKQSPLLAGKAEDDLGFLLGLARQWDGKAFSHYRFWRPNTSTAVLMDSFASMVPPGAAAVEYRPLGQGAALLTVRHFIGAQVRQHIAQAFDRLAADGAERLIIDLRGNQGGEFAGLDLAARLGGPRALMGVFVGPSWWRHHAAAPDAEARASAPELADRSLMGFQAAVRRQPLTAVWHQAHARAFSGPVWILVDRRTASAAELLAAWLRDSGRARLIGETTRGAMLASVFIDLPDGFKLMLPSADYYTAGGERLEAKGVSPHREVSPERALEVASEEIAAMR